MVVPIGRGAAMLSLAHDDFDGVVSCALIECPHPRRWADYPDLPRLLQGYRGCLYATEVNDLRLYQQLPEVILYDHHYSVHRLLGVEMGVPVAARWNGANWVPIRVGSRPAASMVSGLRQLGVEVPGDLARIGDVLDNFALAETREEWLIVAGYLLETRSEWWKQEILLTRSRSEAVEAARRVVEAFREKGASVPWDRVEELKHEAVERAIDGVPVIVVPEREEGLGRLAMLQMEKRYPYVILLRLRGDGQVRGTIVSLTREDAHLLAERLGGGGRRLWPSGSIGGFTSPSLSESLARLRQLLGRGGSTRTSP